MAFSFLIKKRNLHAILLIQQHRLCQSRKNVEGSFTSSQNKMIILCKTVKVDVPLTVSRNIKKKLHTFESTSTVCNWKKSGPWRKTNAKLSDVCVAGKPWHIPWNNIEKQKKTPLIYRFEQRTKYSFISPHKNFDYDVFC